MTKINLSYNSLRNSRLVNNSFWGIAGSGGQTLLLSLFFVILARKYDPSVFALFLIAMTIYQFLSAFSTLGLGQWFTRVIVNAPDRNTIISKFLKIQFISGVTFYLVNIAAAYLLYDDHLLHQLAMVLGINILFDNVIYGIKALNVAEFQQKKTFVILFVDSTLKFLASCVLLVYPLPVLTLAIILIVIRLLTLNIFLRFGSSSVISFRRLLLFKVPWNEVKNIIVPNWAFVIIGSVSMIYWRIGNLIISKTLPLKDVANYEVSYKVFSLALVLPVIISATVFPSLVEFYKAGKMKEFRDYFHKVFYIYLGYSVLVYTFFYSFSDFIIPFAFGENFADNVIYTKEMFLAVLVFPTALLQANVLVALHKERIDMWLNIVSLVVNVAICIVGLYFFKSLTVVNLAIFSSFLIFHICQDVYLLKNKISTISHVIGIYLFVGVLVGCYVFLSVYINSMFLFVAFWALIGCGGILLFTRLRNSDRLVAVRDILNWSKTSPQ